MNKERELLERVSKLRKLRDIQGKKGNHDYDEYMRGLYNGLELALSLFEEEREPQYKNPLAQHEQEPNPVGYLYKQEDCYGDIQTVFKVDKPYIRWHNVTDVVPVYLAPQKREPLSYEEINAIDLPEKQCTIIELVRIIEKAHGIGE